MIVYTLAFRRDQLYRGSTVNAFSVRIIDSMIDSAKSLARGATVGCGVASFTNTAFYPKWGT